MFFMHAQRYLLIQTFSTTEYCFVLNILEKQTVCKYTHNLFQYALCKPSYNFMGGPSNSHPVVFIFRNIIKIMSGMLNRYALILCILFENCRKKYDNITCTYFTRSN